MTTRRSFPHEYKLEAGRAAERSGGVVQMARDLGVNDGLIHPGFRVHESKKEPQQRLLAAKRSKPSAVAGCAPDRDVPRTAQARLSLVKDILAWAEEEMKREDAAGDRWT